MGFEVLLSQTYPVSPRLSNPLPKTLSTHQWQQPGEVFSQAPEALACFSTSA